MARSTGACVVLTAEDGGEELPAEAAAWPVRPLAGPVRLGSAFRVTASRRRLDPRRREASRHPLRPRPEQRSSETAQLPGNTTADDMRPDGVRKPTGDAFRKAAFAPRPSIGEWGIAHVAVPELPLGHLQDDDRPAAVPWPGEARLPGTHSAGPRADGHGPARRPGAPPRPGRALRPPRGEQL